MHTRYHANLSHASHSNTYTITLRNQCTQLVNALGELEEAAGKKQAELGRLRQQEAELEEDITNQDGENSAAVEPALNALHQEIVDAQADIARAREQRATLAATEATLRTETEKIVTATAAAAEAAADYRSELIRTSAEPLRFEKQTKSVVTLVASLTSEIARLRVNVASREAQLSEQTRTTMEVALMRRELEERMKKHHADLDARDEELTVAESLLRAERTKNKDLLERRVELRVETEAGFASVRGVEEEKESVSTAYERAKRELKRAQGALNEVLAAVPALERDIADARAETAAQEGARREAEAAFLMRKRDAEGLLATLLEGEALEARHREALEETRGLVRDAEAERSTWRKEADLVTRQIAAVKAQRDLRSRELSKTSSAKRATLEHSRMKELVLTDLSKRVEEYTARLSRFTAMYEVVKGERNSYVSSISTMAQNVAEMRERLKVLTNEVDILTHESASKDLAIARERMSRTVSHQQRDVLRSEVNKSMVTLRDKQAAVESQIVEIDKTNSAINALERDVAGLKRVYEAAVESRNYAGVQLIDRNDELCVMYEKSRIYDRAMNEGEGAMRVVGDEARTLRIAAADIERRLRLTQSNASEAPEIAERILLGQRDLAAVRAAIERLCVELESPSSADRWVALEGTDPPPELLRGKVRELEARLNRARRELLDTDITLEDASAEAEWLAQSAASAQLSAAAAAVSAAEGDGEAMATSTASSSLTKSAVPPSSGMERQAGQLAVDLQARAKDADRRMRALVSELSMYQATAIQLTAETEAAQAALAHAEAAAGRGEPPTDRAALQARALESAERSLLSASALSGMGNGGSSSTFSRTGPEPRPNSYIPDGLGIPKPYGEFAPFKPGALPSNLRYFQTSTDRRGGGGGGIEAASAVVESSDGRISSGADYAYAYESRNPIAVGAVGDEAPILD